MAVAVEARSKACAVVSLRFGLNKGLRTTLFSGSHMLGALRLEIVEHHSNRRMLLPHLRKLIALANNPWASTLVEAATDRKEVNSVPMVNENAGGLSETPTQTTA